MKYRKGIALDACVEEPPNAEFDLENQGPENFELGEG
jgi:hypothetical protein